MFTTSIFAQSLADYYPLQVGNRWFYKVTDYYVDTTPSLISYFSKEVVGDTIMRNGEKYYVVLEDRRQDYERFDTLSNEIRYYSLSGCPGNDAAQYSLNYIKDSVVIWTSCNLLTYKISFEPSENSDSSYIYLDGDGLVVVFVSFRKYVGIVGQYFLEGGLTVRELIGSRINGKEWGQLTAVNNNKDVKLDYQLDQNYPNPFNPTTTISYTIPVHSFVTLKIYNLLGEEIETIFSGSRERGTVIETWNATSHSSGIYFYRLTAGNFTATRKMSLIK
jgi:hypothetical protein